MNRLPNRLNIVFIASIFQLGACGVEEQKKDPYQSEKAGESEENNQQTSLTYSREYFGPPVNKNNRISPVALDRPILKRSTRTTNTGSSANSKKTKSGVSRKMMYQPIGIIASFANLPISAKESAPKSPAIIYSDVGMSVGENIVDSNAAPQGWKVPENEGPCFDIYATYIRMRSPTETGQPHSGGCGGGIDAAPKPKLDPCVVYMKAPTEAVESVWRTRSPCTGGAQDQPENSEDGDVPCGGWVYLTSNSDSNGSAMRAASPCPTIAVPDTVSSGSKIGFTPRGGFGDNEKWQQQQDKEQAIMEQQMAEEYKWQVEQEQEQAEKQAQEQDRIQQKMDEDYKRQFELEQENGSIDYDSQHRIEQELDCQREYDDSVSNFTGNDFDYIKIQQQLKYCVENIYRVSEFEY